MSSMVKTLSATALEAVKASTVKRLNSLLTVYRTGRPVNVINPVLCGNAIKKIRLSAYKNPILIDMNPGACVWSAALHDALKPRNHILLEPEAKYKPILEEFTRERPNAYWVPLDGYEWETYLKLFAPNPPCPPWPTDRSFPDFDPKFVPPEDGVNTDIIFTANLSMASDKGDRLLAQFLSAGPLGRWVQKFGRVRYLIWVPDILKERYLPRGISGRGRPAAIAETVCTVQEVASSPIVRSGKGHPRAADLEFDEAGNPILEKEKPKRIGRPPLKEAAGPAGRPRGLPLSIEEIREALDRIDKARGDPEAAKALEEELLAKENREEKVAAGKRGRPKTVGAISKQTVREQKIAERAAFEAAQQKAVEENAAIIAAEIAAGVPKSAQTKPIKARKPHGRPPGHSLGARPMLTPELDRIRVNLQRMMKQDTTEKTVDPAVYGLMDKVNETDRSMQRKAQKVLDSVRTFLEKGEDRWIRGMKHPAWWYRENPDAITELADSMVKERSEGGMDFKGHIRVIDPEAAIGALEDLGDEELGTGDEELKSKYDEFEARWGKKLDATGVQNVKEDQVIAYYNKILQWQNRQYDSIPVSNEDFHPATPLALLDFTPLHLDEYFRPPEPSMRETNWEIYAWMLRSLFGLRAHSIGSALNTLASGGEHIISDVDETLAGGKIHPEMRTRTLTVKQLIELTKAWNNWPFRVENAHLDHWETQTTDKLKGKTSA